MEYAKREYENILKRNSEKAKRRTETSEEILALERMLQTVDHADLSLRVEQNMKNVSDQLRKRFNSKEISLMETGW